MKRILSPLLLCLMLVSPACAGFDDGLAPYKSSDFTTALRE
jgi:hypothetical protein